MISPDFPFREGASFEDLICQKVVVMMTDGNNTTSPYYSAYGGARRNSVSVSDLNERFEETCTEMKQKGIQIYTVTFTSNISSNTKGYYERCASDATKYLDSVPDVVPGERGYLKSHPDWRPSEFRTKTWHGPGEGKLNSKEVRKLQRSLEESENIKGTNNKKIASIRESDCMITSKALNKAKQDYCYLICQFC